MTENHEPSYSKDAKLIILLFMGMLFLSVALSIAVTAKSHKEAEAIMENAGHRPTEAEVEEWVETHKNPVITLSHRGNYFFYNTQGQVIYRPDIQRRLDDEIKRKAKRPQILRIFNL